MQKYRKAVAEFDASDSSLAATCQSLIMLVMSRKFPA